MLDIVLRSVNKMGRVLTLGQGAEKINTIWNNTGGCPTQSPHTSEPDQGDTSSPGLLMGHAASLSPSTKPW